MSPLAMLHEYRIRIIRSGKHTEIDSKSCWLFAFKFERALTKVVIADGLEKPLKLFAQFI